MTKVSLKTIQKMNAEELVSTESQAIWNNHILFFEITNNTNLILQESRILLKDITYGTFINAN